MAELNAGIDTDAAEEDAMSGDDERVERISRLRDDAESDPLNEQTEEVTRSGSIEDKEEQITTEPSSDSNTSDSGGDSGGSTSSEPTRRQERYFGDSGGSSDSDSGSSSGGSSSSGSSGSSTPTSDEGGPYGPPSSEATSDLSGSGGDDGSSSSPSKTTDGGGTDQPSAPEETTRFNPESSPGPTPTDQGVEQYGRTDKYVSYEGEQVTLREAARRFELEAAERAGVSPEDTAVLTEQTGDGSFQFRLSYTQSGEAKATADALRSEYGVGEDIISSEGENVVVDTRGLNESVMTRPGAPGPTARAEGKSLQVERTGSTAGRINAALGGYSAAVSQTGSRVGEGEPTPASRRVGDDTARFISRQIAASRASEATGRDVSVEDVRIRDGEVQFTENEQLGDIDWSFGLGGPEDEVEQALEGASQTVMDAGEGFANFLFNEETGAFRNPAGDDILRAVGQDQLAEDYEREAREFSKGVARGSAMLLNVPGVAKAGLEAAEIPGYAFANPTEATTRTKSIAKSTGASVYNEALKNKAGTAGLLAGSLAGSYGIMKLGSKVGPRTGAATRYAIQPGEELAGSLGYRATRRVAGTGAADKLFPMKEPLIFSEEAAIRGLRSAGNRVRGLGGRAGQSELAQSIRSYKTDIETRIGEASDRAPSVSLRRESGAMPIEIDARAREQASNLLQTTRRTELGKSISGDANTRSFTDLAESGIERARGLYNREPNQIFPGERNPLGTADIEARTAEEVAMGAGRLRSAFEPTPTLRGERNPLGTAEIETQTASEVATGAQRLRAAFEPTPTLSGPRNPLGTAELRSRGFEAAESGLSRLRPPEYVQGARNPLGLPISTTLGETPLSTRAASSLRSSSPTDLGRPLPLDIGETPLSTRVANRLQVVQGKTDLGRPLPTDLGEPGLSELTLRVRGGKAPTESELDTGSFIEGDVEADAFDFDFESEATVDTTPDLDIGVGSSAGRQNAISVARAETVVEAETGTDMVNPRQLQKLKTEPAFGFEDDLVDSVGDFELADAGESESFLQPQSQPSIQDTGPMELPFESTRQPEVLIEGNELELLSEAEVELEQEQFLELEVEMEAERELELETELEQEAELETFLEGETRHEVDPFGMRVRRRRSNDPFGSYDESSSILERSLLNPFTGE